LGLLVACAVVGTLVLGRRWYLAGLMTACVGLAAWSVRGGSMLYVLLRADSTGANGRVFLQLLGELIVFFFVIGAMWNFLWVRHFRAGLAAAPRADEQNRSPGAAILAQIGLMAVLLLILAATARKKQILAAVFIAGWAATGIAEAYFADRKAARWYWVGPLAVGAIGYLANYFSAGSSALSLEVGQMSGTFAPLSRVLPLDYASLGCAGAILGYWMASTEQGEAKGTGELSAEKA
ncbi:MAG TPA: hypothetical protein VFC78_10945, partial [Tepidisphaeraceae bacterium]|nr:hypothetical protein [Tepidisphaeraceae bacterium]